MWHLLQAQKWKMKPIRYAASLILFTQWNSSNCLKILRFQNSKWISNYLRDWKDLFRFACFIYFLYIVFSFILSLFSSLCAMLSFFLGKPSSTWPWSNPLWQSEISLSLSNFYFNHCFFYFVFISCNISAISIYTYFLLSLLHALPRTIFSCKWINFSAIFLPPLLVILPANSST